jgi:hypothetical protein
VNNLTQGLIAGFVATLVLSALMLLKSMMGLMPDLNVIAMLAKMTGGGPVMGWVAHFAIGTILWGGLFAYLEPRIPGGSDWIKGMVFSIGPWLLMMIAIMPMAGAGFFGAGLGIMAAVMTLVLHLIFGAVLGATYSALVARGGATA